MTSIKIWAFFFFKDYLILEIVFLFILHREKKYFENMVSFFFFSPSSLYKC